MGFFGKLLNSVVEKYGIVIEGDYVTAPIACDGVRVIFHSKENFCFTKKEVSSFKILGSSVRNEISKKTGRLETVQYTTAEINFNDGKKSTIEVNNTGLSYISKILG